MDVITHIPSPLGTITLASDGAALIGLWFEGQKHDCCRLSPDAVEAEAPVFVDTRRWLDCYFSGGIPDFTPPLAPRGTDFQQRVWVLLCQIPYGATVSYGELAARLGCPSPRAVGQAVGRNPISLLIPCHRVQGAGGRLTGYAGGLRRKEALLRLEGILSKEESSCR